MAEEATEVATQQVWAVRAGQGAAHADRFLADDLVAIGFGVAKSIEGLDWDGLIDTVREAMPGQSATSHGLSAGMLHRLANEIKVGDLVMTPEPTGTLLVGEIAGPYRFLPTPIVEDFRQARPVRWFGRLVRQDLPEGARNTLGSLLSLFLPSFQVELLAAIEPLRGGEKPPPLPHASAAATLKAGQTLSISQLQLVDPPPPSGYEPVTDKPKALFLLDKIDARELALPDFQRSFVWDPALTRELLVSIARGFPAGNLLFLEGGAKHFLPRAAEEAPALNGHEPNLLILDGQQRLSSLYQAFRGRGQHRFFIDIAALARGDEIDGCIKVFSVHRAKPWGTLEGQARSLMFPLERVRDFTDWMYQVIDYREALDGPESKMLRNYMVKVNEAVIKPILDYRFPTTTLDEGTSPEAVCTIFEALNRLGIKLTVFELITARAFAQGHRLRERWAEAQDRYPVLEDFEVEPYYILQAVALRLGKIPQRGIVIALDVNEMMAEWDGAVLGMAEALKMLREECGVLTPRWMPYATMLPTLAAAWRDVEAGHGPQEGARRFKLQRWFWCATFADDYASAPNSRAAADVPLLHEWLTGGEVPPVVRDFAFEPNTWREIAVHQRGLYRATMALLLAHGPRDFHKGQLLTPERINETSADDHHIFPSGYLQDKQLDNLPDTVLNHTLIDKTTNIRIGKKAPSQYLDEIKQDLGADLPKVLASHGLPVESDSPLARDDYKAFLEWRLEFVRKELDRVTGEAVMRAPTKASTAELLAQGEGDDVEFKSSGRYNSHIGGKDPRIEQEVVLTVAGFQNASGGTLLIGVDDGGVPLGLDHDYALIAKPDDDRYQLWLQDLLRSSLGTNALPNVQISFDEIDGSKVCRVDVKPSSAPVYAKALSGGSDEFYVRMGNSTRKLTLQEFDSYRQQRWPA